MNIATTNCNEVLSRSNFSVYPRRNVCSKTAAVNKRERRFVIPCSVDCIYGKDRCFNSTGLAAEGVFDRGQITAGGRFHVNFCLGTTTEEHTADS